MKFEFWLHCSKTHDSITNLCLTFCINELYTKTELWGTVEPRENPQGGVVFFWASLQKILLYEKKTHPQNFILPGKLVKTRKSYGGVGPWGFSRGSTQCLVLNRWLNHKNCSRSAPFFQKSRRSLKFRLNIWLFYKEEKILAKGKNDDYYLTLVEPTGSLFRLVLKLSDIFCKVLVFFVKFSN